MTGSTHLDPNDPDRRGVEPTTDPVGPTSPVDPGTQPKPTDDDPELIEYENTDPDSPGAAPR